MSDPVFTGATVEDALARASSALGVPGSSLRYVVLESGGAGGRGLGPTPAVIAVLLQGSDRGGGRRQEEPGAQRDVREGICDLVRSVARTAGVELDVVVDDSGEAFRVEISGAGKEIFLSERADLVQILEHLLDRAYGHDVAPQRIRVICEGYRQFREEVLRKQALELAQAVSADGVARRTAELNSYERRIVHMAVGETPGLKSVSIGEGRLRRVTILPDEGAVPEA